MKRKINLLIVGTASRAQSLLGELVKMPDVHIAGLADLLPERLEKPPGSSPRLDIPGPRSIPITGSCWT